MTATSTTSSQAAILLVEDDTLNQVVARGVLSALGYRQVTLAENGLQALDAFCRQAFDLVLMDCQMPEMDGLCATRILRERGVTVPILAVTAGGIVGDRERCLEAGMDDYLTKPIVPRTLALVLARWLQAPERCGTLVARPALQAWVPSPLA